MKKFGLISLGLPPSQSGQSVVLYHLLKEFDPCEYSLITLKNFYLYKNLGNCSERLLASHYFVHPDFQIIRGLIKTASTIHFKQMIDILLKIRVRQYKKILNDECCYSVVGCTGDFFDPPAAFLASKKLGIPFIFYAFDYYSMQWTDPFLRACAAQYEEKIVHGATRVIVPNECMRMEYWQRYGVRASLIHNPFDLAAYEKNIKTTSDIQKHDDKRIVYTGAIYEAHYSAIKNLISAMRKSKIPGLSLHLYTPQSQLRLEMNGISGPVIVHKQLPNHRIPEIQRNADILFLPLAFGSMYPEVIRTSSPGKIGEYLASKKPILVHAPQDSFVSWYFKKHRCALVISDNNPDLLGNAIERLLNDGEFCHEIIQNAYHLALAEFDVGVARSKFRTILNDLS